MVTRRSEMQSHPSIRGRARPLTGQDPCNGGDQGCRHANTAVGVGFRSGEASRGESRGYDAVPLARRGRRRSARTLSPSALRSLTTRSFSVYGDALPTSHDSTDGRVNRGLVQPREPLGVHDPCVAGAAVPKSPNTLTRLGIRFDPWT